MTDLLTLVVPVSVQIIWLRKPEELQVRYVLAPGIPSRLPAGDLRMIRADSPRCFEVTSVEVFPDGWGPLLYDVAMETALLVGARGLAADRQDVSEDAMSVWAYYAHRRPDVVSAAVPLTYRSRVHGQEDPSSPLNFTYALTPGAGPLRALREAGRLLDPHGVVLAGYT